MDVLEEYGRVIYKRKKSDFREGSYEYYKK